MVRKYARLLEERDINSKTGEVWKIDDVPNTWRDATIAKVEEDGYYFEEDGTVNKKPENEQSKGEIDYVI